MFVSHSNEEVMWNILTEISEKAQKGKERN